MQQSDHGLEEPTISERFRAHVRPRRNAAKRTAREKLEENLEALRQGMNVALARASAAERKAEAALELANELGATELQVELALRRRGFRRKG